MEHITSRKNNKLLRLKALGADPSLRRETGEYLCDGLTTLEDALSAGAELTALLWCGEPKLDLPSDIEQYTCPAEVFQSMTPLKSSRGPLFAVRMPARDYESPISSAVVLEGVQDPGNVGTVVRTANALGIDAVLLAGDCADVYGVKTVRATMGGIFRQRILTVTVPEVRELADKNGLKLYGAALSDTAIDVREAELTRCAVCIGSEGGGLSGELLALCDGQVIIPMEPGCESLNASVAASILMWEMTRGRS